MAPLRQVNCPGLHRSSVEPKGKRPLRKRRQQWRWDSQACRRLGPGACPDRVRVRVRGKAPHPRHGSLCATSNTHLTHFCSESDLALDYRGHKRAHLSPQEGLWVNKKHIHTHTFLMKSKSGERTTGVLTQREEGETACT